LLPRISEWMRRRLYRSKTATVEKYGGVNNQVWKCEAHKDLSNEFSHWSRKLRGLQQLEISASTMDDGNLSETGKDKFAETSDGCGQKVATKDDITGKREIMQR